MKSNDESVLGLTLLLLASSCGGGGGGGGGGVDTVSPPVGLDAPPLLSGITSAVAGETSVRIDWKLPVPGFESALFQSNDPTAVYAGAPIVQGLVTEHLVLNNLPTGAEHYFGLGLRAGASGPFQPSGAIVRVRTAAVIYVDPGADPAVADGTSPGTAFADPLLAAIEAFNAGGGNLWLLGADYGAGSLPVFAGTDVYGGFAPGFDLDERDTSAHPTRLTGGSGQTVVAVQGGAPGTILDGLWIDGKGLAGVGIDMIETPLELRDLVVSSCRDRGIRMRASLSDDPLPVQLVSVGAVANGADGLSAAGSLDLDVHGSRFDSNVQEGMEIDDLVAPEGDRATLRVRDSRFFGNGTEGLDVDLSAPPAIGPAGGRFRIDIESTRFERNGADGMLVDFDYEFVPGWTSLVTVQDSLARANGGDGFKIDADWDGEIMLHRVVASANGGDGFELSSETRPGMAVVVGSVLAGNLGAGIRASFGNRSVLASHCILAGNVQGGVVSEVVESAATSCVAYLQDLPWSGTRAHFSAEVTDPLAAAFERVPEAYYRVLSDSAGTLQLEAGADVPFGALLEIDDDGMDRSASEVDGTLVTIDPAPEGPRSPTLLGLFVSGGSVTENYRLPAGSPLEGMGMTPPGGGIVDAGVWGSPVPGEPGRETELDEPVFWVSDVGPALPDGVGQDQDLLLSFLGGELDPTSLSTDAVRAVTSTGQVLGIDFSVLGEQLIVSPPLAGWGAEPFLLELHASLRSMTGAPLCAPLALPFNPL